MTEQKTQLNITENKIPDGWIETSLGEVCEIIMGQSPKGESYNMHEDGLPFYQGVTEFDDKYVKTKMYTSDPTKIVEPNTILFSVRAPVGKVNFTKHKSCIGRGNAGLIMKNGNQEFLFYLLKFLEKQIQGRTSGTVFASISGKELKDIPIMVPINPIKQKAIASVLSSFDDKIELLREENKTLEEIGQTIFKEWLGKYSVERPDELPEGWRVGRLGEVCDLVIDNRGKTPPVVERDDNSMPLVEVNAIVGDSRIVDLNQCKKFVDHETYNTWFRKGHPRNGDVLISTVGSIGQLAQVFDEKLCIAQNIVALRFSGFGNFLYAVLKNTQDEIISIDISSVQPSIKVPHLLNIEIVIPQKEILEEFEKNMSSIVNKINQNYLQIQTIARIRDELLPRLMNGEVVANQYENLDFK